jgi:hypothetical protein
MSIHIAKMSGNGVRQNLVFTLLSLYTHLRFIYSVEKVKL